MIFNCHKDVLRDKKNLKSILKLILWETNNEKYMKLNIFRLWLLYTTTREAKRKKRSRMKQHYLRPSKKYVTCQTQNAYTFELRKIKRVGWKFSKDDLWRNAVSTSKVSNNRPREGISLHHRLPSLAFNKKHNACTKSRGASAYEKT